MQSLGNFPELDLCENKELMSNTRTHTLRVLLFFSITCYSSNFEESSSACMRLTAAAVGFFTTLPLCVHTEQHYINILYLSDRRVLFLKTT